jgi:uncharacterized protein YerC
MHLRAKNSTQIKGSIRKLLEQGNLSYREIHRITGASLTTIGRVARFLKDESYNGYQVMLNKLRK